jgi:hypothetical protein
MADIFRDMLPGTALPLVTQLVMGHAGAFLVAAVLLAVLGIGLLVFSPASGRGIVAATVVIVVLFVQWRVIVSAMQSPLTQLMNQIGEPYDDEVVVGGACWRLRKEKCFNGRPATRPWSHANECAALNFTR